MLKNITLLVVLFFGALAVQAHEGHNDVPGALKANHGGVVKAGKEINLEYVISGEEVKLHLISHEQKALSTDDVKLSATVKLPKGKSEALKLDIKDGIYTAQIDFKSAYRAEVIVKADHGGKPSIFKFQVEK